MSDFVIGQRYPRKDIAEKLGGNWMAFLPIQNNSVVACCYKPRLNRLFRNSNRLLVGEPRLNAARRFAEERKFVPFFEHGPGGWEYIGDYHVRDSSEVPAIIEAAKLEGFDQNVQIVLYCESFSEAALRAQSNKEHVEQALIDHAAKTEPTSPTNEAGDGNSNEEQAESTPGARRQADVEKRALVEKVAVDCVCAHFEGMGYKIRDKQSEKVGWDLEATKGGQTLLLEVKGVSGKELLAELTPNEYEKMKKNWFQYRVCVVVNALDAGRKLHVLNYSPNLACLTDESRIRVRITDVTGARLSLDTDRNRK